jgi:hypothetical protein
MIVDGAGMNGNVMPDGHVVADMGRTGLMGHMHTAAILDVRAVADGDRSHITANHSVEPYAAFVAHRDVAYDSSVLAKIAISPPFGSETAITFYQSHASVD